MKRKAREIDKMATGQRIRLLRKEKGLTSGDVQRFFEFTNSSSVLDWEKGKNVPTLEHLCALAYLLDVRVDDILVYSYIN